MLTLSFTKSCLITFKILNIIHLCISITSLLYFLTHEFHQGQKYNKILSFIMCEYNFINIICESLIKNKTLIKDLKYTFFRSLIIYYSKDSIIFNFTNTLWAAHSILTCISPHSVFRNQKTEINKAVYKNFINILMDFFEFLCFFSLNYKFDVQSVIICFLGIYKMKELFMIL